MHAPYGQPLTTSEPVDEASQSRPQGHGRGYGCFGLSFSMFSPVVRLV